MTLHRPLYMQAAGGDTPFEYDARTMRLGITAAWATEGVVDSGSFAVSQRSAGANMSVDVASGFAIVTGNDVSNQGTYICRSDAVENVTVPAAPASGSRTHRVCLYVQDKLHDGTLAAETYEFEPTLLEDTGSGTPALPASAINLATVTVAAGQTSVTDSDIDDIRISALARTSQARHVASSAARPPVPLVAEEIFRTDLGCKEISDGSSWYEVPRRGGGGSAWTSYTPTLTATTTSPTLGTGSTRTGAYMQVGKMVTVRASVKFGTSGTAAGSGTYEVSLPVTAKTISVGRQQGTATFFDNSANDFGDGAVFIDNGATTKVKLSMDSSVVTNSAPWTWAASDQLDFTITYEAA